MQTHAHYLAQYLSNHNYQINVVTYHAVTRLEEKRHQDWDAGLPYPVHRILSRIGHFANLAKLETLARSTQADLIYCSTVFYGELSNRLNIPVIARSVGNDVLRPWIVYPYRTASRLLSSRFYEKYLYRYFRSLDYPEFIEALWRKKRRSLMIDSAKKLSCIFANSEFTKSELEDIGVTPSHIRVLTGGVEFSVFNNTASKKSALRKNLNIPKDRYILLTACRLEHKKAIDFLIESMPQLLNQFPDAHLVVVGSGRKERKLKNLARKSSATERITFAGRVEHQQIHDYYQIADLFVLPSRIHIDPITGLRDAETMGRVLCEANAASVPIIASNSGGIPSVIRHDVNGLLFETDNIQSYIDAVTIVRSQPDRTKLRVENGKMFAQHHFDWSVILEKHQTCFESFQTEETANHV